MTNDKWDDMRETIGQAEESSDRLVPSEKKVSRRTKIRKEKILPAAEVARDEFGQPVYKGTMTIPKMSVEEKKAFSAFIQHGTQETGDIVIPGAQQGHSVPTQNKTLPQNQVMKKHLLVKSIKLSKDMKGGGWIFDEVETNHGVFSFGQEQNERINQKMIQSLALYIKEIFEDDLKEHLGMNNKEDK